MDVGEPIAEVRDEGGRVVVPVVCLIEAAVRWATNAGNAFGSSGTGGLH